MTLRRMSDGVEIPDLPEDEEMTPEAYQRLRAANPHARAMKALDAHREAEAARVSPESDHDAAVREFDEGYGKHLHTPHGIRETLKERERVKEEAVKKGQRIDWHVSLRDIADKVNGRLGYPTTDEQERYETLREMKTSRGKS